MSPVYIGTDGAGCSLHDDLHGFEVIPSYFRVGYPAVTLRGSDGVVPQEILDRREIGVSSQLHDDRFPVHAADLVPLTGRIFA
jgi:hypothetical protein